MASILAGLDGPIDGVKEGNWIINPDASATILPYGYFGNSGDDAAIMVAAKNRLLSLYPTLPGVKIRLIPYTYVFASTASFTEVLPIGIKGGGTQATIIQSLVNGDCISRSQNYVPSGGSAGVKVWGDYMSDFTIDISAAGSSAVGLHVGDQKYAQYKRIAITGPGGQVGAAALIDNRKFWTENCKFEMHATQCNPSFVLDATGVGGTATGAHDNCEYDFDVAGAPNADGVVIRGGSNPYNSRFNIHGGIESSATPPGAQNYMLRVIGNDGSGGKSVITQCELNIRMESDGGLAHKPGMIYTDLSGNDINHCNGSLIYGTGSGTPSSIAGKFVFTGVVFGDSVLQALAPSGPGTIGSPNTNIYGPQMLHISGGSVTGVLINGISTGRTSGGFVVPAGATYEIDGGAPTTTVWTPLNSL